MSRRYFPLSQLAAAAQANGCTVHMHHDEDLGNPIYSVGNSNIGAREFDDFDAALKFVTGGKFSESDCAAQAGAVIAENCLNGMLDLDNQTDRANLLAAALVDLATLKHHEHAAAGFAGALVAVIERGLKRIGNASQLDNIFMQNEVGRMMAERESEICNGPSNIDVDDCLICGRATEILNVGREHFAVCLPCKTYRHIGSNLFSGWKFETPGDWAKNRQILDALIEHKLAPTPAPDDAPLPF